VGQFAEGFISNWPVLLETLATLMLSLLDKVIEAIPKIIEVVGEIIDGMVLLMGEKGPDLIEAGFVLFTEFLESLREHIPTIVDLGIDILIALIEGIEERVEDIATAATDLITTFIGAIAGMLGDILTAGVEAFEELVAGIIQNIDTLLDTGIDLIKKLIEGVAGMVLAIMQAGRKAFGQFVDGLVENILDMIEVGKDAIVKLIEGVALMTVELIAEGFRILLAFINGLTAAIDEYAPQLREAALELGIAIIDGATGGLISKAQSLYDSVTGIFQKTLNAGMDVIDANSPSKEFMKIGGYMIDGLVIGVDDKESEALRSVESVTGNVLSAFQQSLSQVPAALDGLEEFHPTITPVLDLGKAKTQAQALHYMLRQEAVDASGYAQAQLISYANQQRAVEIDTAEIAVQGTGDVTYEQNIYSPTALSTNDIYRQTRNQITLAKEELSIR